MTRIGFAYNPTKPAAMEMTERSVAWCHDHGVDSWAVESDATDELTAHLQQSDYLVVLGGDGTFLRATRALARVDVPVLGVNSGRIGFLAKVDPEGLEQLLADLVAENFEIEARMLLEARLQLMQAQVEPHFLFNTLANVQHLVETDPPEASRVLDSLIKYLRAALPQVIVDDEDAKLARRAEVYARKPHFEIAIGVVTLEEGIVEDLDVDRLLALIGREHDLARGSPRGQARSQAIIHAPASRFVQHRKGHRERVRGRTHPAHLQAQSAGILAHAARSTVERRLTAIRIIAAARSNAERFAHPDQASFAAAIARSTSARVPWGTVPICSPVAGLVASMRAWDSPVVHSPARYIE